MSKSGAVLTSYVFRFGTARIFETVVRGLSALGRSTGKRRPTVQNTITLELIMLISDHETEIDCLNYDAITLTVVELLKDNRERPLIVGIHGEWGAGKSIILKMIETELSSDTNVAKGQVVNV